MIIILSKEVVSWKGYLLKYVYQLRKVVKNGWFKKFPWTTHRKSRAGTNEIFQPQWPFYEDMGNFVTPCPTKSNTENLSRTDTQTQRAYIKKQCNHRRRRHSDAKAGYGKSLSHNWLFK